MTPSLSTSTRYILPTGLPELHQQTNEWRSDLGLWKQELAFFGRLIDQYGKDLCLRDEIRELNHFRFLLNYYSSDLMNSLAARIGNHEVHLGLLMKELERQDESGYRTEHNALARQVQAFEQEYLCFKNELYGLLEKALNRSKTKMEQA
jgi:hypothetical protein